MKKSYIYPELNRIVPDDVDFLTSSAGDDFLGDSVIGNQTADDIFG